MIIQSNASGRTITINKEEFLFFSGTSYLGITQNASFIKSLFEGINKYGTNYGNSRNSNVQVDIFDEAEKSFANLSGAPSALTASSGYMAGQLVFNLFAKSGKIYYAPNVHPAVCGDDYCPFDGTFDQWKIEVSKKIQSIKTGNVILICNAVDPLYLEPYNYQWLSELPKEKQVVVILDDSHGYGITGKNGGGIYSFLKDLNNIELIVTASLGKACGIPGGLILAREEIIATIKSSTMFTGSSPIAPAYLYAWLKSQDIFEKARQNLKKNIQFFRDLIIEEDTFKFLADYPVFYTAENSLYEYLKHHKIIISSFPYPLPDSNPITRIVLTALHLEEDLRRLALIIKKRND